MRLLRVKFGLFTVVLNLLLMLAVQSKATAQKNIPTSKSTDVIALQSQQLSQKHLLAESIKPTVVRIVNGCVGKAYWSKNGKTYNLAAVGSGSGYFVNPNGYIVTNAHVIESSKNENYCLSLLFKNFVEQIAEESGENPQKLLVNSVALQKLVQESDPTAFKLVKLVFLTNGEALPFETIVSGALAGRGKDVAIVKVNVKNAPILKLADSNKVELLEHVTVAGYPIAGDSDAILGDQSRYIPTITDGIISAKKYQKDGLPVLQISAPTTHGSSGAPAVNDRGEVVGIVTFGGNQANGQFMSGFSFIVPSNTIMEFVQQAGIVNHEGLVNHKYREGLQLYSKGKYQMALQKFQEVKRLFRQHSEVEQWMQNCQQAIAQK